MKKVINVTKYFDDDEVNLIKERLKARHIFCSNIARKLGFSNTYICNMLKGRQQVNFDLIDYLKDNNIFDFEGWDL